MATFAPGRPDVISHSIITKFGLSGDAASSVEQLFQVPDGAVHNGVSVASAILLFYSGVSFTRRLQKMYRSAWDLQKTGVRGNLFATLGLVVLLGEVVLLYAVMTLVRTLPDDWLTVLPISALAGVVPWTSVPYLLLDRQVHWRRLLAGGVLTATTMAFYGMATTLYMPGVVEESTSQFGLFGVTVALIGWLLGAMGIVVASAAVGAEFDLSHARWVVRVKRRAHLVDPALGPSALDEIDESSTLTREDLVLLSHVLVSWAVVAGAVWVAAVVVPGIHVQGGVLTYLLVSLLLGLVNALLGPSLRLLAMDVTWFRVGAAALAVNAAMLSLTALLVSGLSVDGPVAAVMGALVVSVAATVCDSVTQTSLLGISP